MHDLDRRQRLFVAAMAEKLRVGGIGRREFLRAAELGRMTTGKQGVEETLEAIQKKTVAFLAAQGR
jgi:hypothetical protein